MEVAGQNVDIVANPELIIDNSDRDLWNCCYQSGVGTKRDSLYWFDAASVTETCQEGVLESLKPT